MILNILDAILVLLFAVGVVLTVTLAAAVTTMPRSVREQLSPRTLRLMGLRPIQPRPRLYAGPPRCSHSAAPVPVEVRDTLDGSPEIVAWLCPSCGEEARPSHPPGRGSVSRPTDAADVMPIILTGDGRQLGGITVAQASENIRASLQRHARAIEIETGAHTPRTNRYLIGEQGPEPHRSTGDRGPL